MLGDLNDGLIDYQQLYLTGVNRAVVAIDNTSLTLVHEIGHLMGLTHSRRQEMEVAGGTFPWSLGHGIDDDFTTIMSYDTEFNALGLGFFSSPDLSCGADGLPCGVARSDLSRGANAVLSLQTTAIQVAAIANGMSPVLSILGDNPAYLANISLVSGLTASANDLEDGDVASAVTFEIIAPSVVDEAYDYEQVYAVTDSNGNTSIASRRIVIRDESLDTDADGVLDINDSFPNDASETTDSDSDGVGDNTDVYPSNAEYAFDSDADGMPDTWERLYGLDPNDASDATSDQDQDGVSAFDEFIAGTTPVSTTPVGPIPAGSLDIDGNGEYDALTDGLLLLIGMFGLSDAALINGAVPSNATYTSAEEIAARIELLGDLIDIDGNGEVDVLTDGLVILRYLFGLRGEVLIRGVVASDAMLPSSSDIGDRIESLMPAL